MGLKKPLCDHVTGVTEDGKLKNKCIHCGHTKSGAQEQATRWAEHLVECEGPSSEDKNYILQKYHSDKLTKLAIMLDIYPNTETATSPPEPAVVIKQNARSGAHTQSAPTSSSKKRSSATTTITKFVDSCDDARSKKIRSKMAAFVVENGLAVHVLETPSCQEMFLELNSAVKPFLPSARTFIQNDLPAYQQAIHEELEGTIHRFAERYLTLGIDGFFMNEGSQHVYLVTAAKADKVMFVSCQAESEPDATELARVVDRILKEKAGERPVETVFAGLSFDNAKVDPAVGQIIQQSYPKLFIAGCRAHAANLLIDDIAEKSAIKNVVDRALSMATFIQSHKRVRNVYEEMKKDFYGATSQKAFKNTRFANCDLTLQHVVGKASANLKIMRKIIYDPQWNEWTEKIAADVANEFVNNVLDCDFIEILETVRQLTSSVSVFTHHIERPGARASWIVPLFHELKKALSTWVNDPETIRKGMRVVGQEIMEMFDNRYKGGNGKEPVYHKELLLAAILDPYTAVDETTLDAIEPDWASHCTSIFDSFFRHDEDCVIKVHKAEMELLNLVHSVGTGIGVFGDQATKCQETLDKLIGQKANTLSDLAHLVERQKESLEFTPVTYWNGQFKREYPTLFIVAERLVPLAIQSGDVERCCKVNQLVGAEVGSRLKTPGVSKLIGGYVNARLLRRMNQRNDGEERERKKARTADDEASEPEDDTALLNLLDAADDMDSDIERSEL